MTDSQIWSPATQLGIMPNVLGFQSAMTNLIKTGMRDCYNGFSWGVGCGWTSQGRGQTMFSARNASDADSTITELNLLLAGGRLSPTRKAFIIQK